MERLVGQHVLVTGSARGIGRAVALRLAGEGAALTLLDRRAEELAEVVEQINERGGTVVASPTADVTDTPGLLATIEAADSARPLDGMVNVAGIGLCAQFLDLEIEQWRRTLDVNLTAVFVTCQAIGRRMAARGRGRIVNMASISGKAGSEILADYCASKAGLISLTQSAARALGPAGVTVNAVCPGLVWTPMWRETATWMGSNNPQFAAADLAPEEVYGAVVEAMTPMKRPTTVEDIAATVAFLLSEDARMITGQAINVDGGIEVH
ncbi:MAG TPA: SDR family NAD(P)-dependent oxidoreductase [Thermopolyspora sp.]|jgi:Dehydrogenases with different specificities (related to short-chain alcohol dehydrogenases)